MKNLFKKLKDIFEIPFDPSDENSNRDAIVSGLLNVAILVGGIYLFPFTMARSLFSTQILIMWGAFFVLIVLRVATSKGYANIVSFVLLFTFWTTIVYVILIFENGLRAPAYTAALAFIIAYAGLLHGRRIAWVITGISILLNTLVLIGEFNGVFLVEPKIPDIRWALLGQIVFFSGIIFMLSKTLQNLKKSISLYRIEARNRLEAEIDVRRLHDELETAYETTLEGWAQALELRDKETEGHSQRVTDLSIKLAKQLGFDEDEIKYIYYGALLHDIGKMGIPDEILNKPGSLTPEERKIVQQHPIFAYEMLKDIKYLQPAIAIPYSHHEHWDGTGYPQGLKGEEIPLYARIFAIIDNWDALNSDRPYRNAWPLEKTIEYLKEQSGKIFDPLLVDLFLLKTAHGD